MAEALSTFPTVSAPLVDSSAVSCCPAPVLPAAHVALLNLGCGYCVVLLASGRLMGILDVSMIGTALEALHS